MALRRVVAAREDDDVARPDVRAVLGHGLAPVQPAARGGAVGAAHAGLLHRPVDEGGAPRGLVVLRLEAGGLVVLDDARVVAAAPDLVRAELAAGDLQMAGHAA